MTAKQKPFNEIPSFAWMTTKQKLNKINSFAGMTAKQKPFNTTPSFAGMTANILFN